MTWLINGSIYTGITYFIIIKFPSTAGNYERIVDWGNGGLNNCILVCRSGTDAAFLGYITNPNGTFITSSAVPNDNNFHVFIMNIVNTSTGFTINFYVDNVTSPVSTATSGSALSNRTMTVNYIGRSANGTNDCLLNANIQEINVYNTSLSQTDMSNRLKVLKLKWGI